jgi:hypothetical protein
VDLLGWREVELTPCEGVGAAVSVGTQGGMDWYSPCTFATLSPF